MECSKITVTHRLLIDKDFTVHAAYPIKLFNTCSILLLVDKITCSLSYIKWFIVLNVVIG